MEIKTPVLVDALEMSRKNPDTFDAVPVEEIDAVQVGDHIKVCPESERFWVQVEEIVQGHGYDREFVGRVDNDLICTEEHGLELNDKIRLLGRNIYNIH